MAERTCSISGCARPVRARGWCPAHYSRWQRYGDPGEIPIAPRRSPAPGARCECDGCEGVRFARGFCRQHYGRWTEDGERMNRAPFGPRPTTEGPCRAQPCEKPIVSLGYCHAHYWRVRRHGSTADPRALTPEQIADKAEAERQYQLEWKRKHYAANIEKMRRRTTEWRRSNPTRAKLHEAKKRHRRRSAPSVPFTADQLAQKIAYWGGKCWVCRAPYQQIDHVKPLSKGGWHVLANLRPICQPCNGKKHDRWPYP